MKQTLDFSSEEIFCISARNITESVSLDASFMKSKKWTRLGNEAKRIVSFLDPAEAIVLDCTIEDDGNVQVFGNHDWFTIYFFMRAFILEQKGKALGFRNFLSIDSNWAKDPVMSRILARRMLETKGSLKDSQGLVWL